MAGCWGEAPAFGDWVAGACVAVGSTPASSAFCSSEVAESSAVAGASVVAGAAASAETGLSCSSAFQTFLAPSVGMTRFSSAAA